MYSAILKLAEKHSGKQSEVDTEVSQIAAILNQGIDDNFFDWGSELAGVGARYFKHSDQREEHGMGECYIGEWSKESEKPQGRGISLDRQDITIYHCLSED